MLDADFGVNIIPTEIITFTKSKQLNRDNYDTEYYPLD